MVFLVQEGAAPRDRQVCVLGQAKKADSSNTNETRPHECRTVYKQVINYTRGGTDQWVAGAAEAALKTPVIVEK